MFSQAWIENAARAALLALGTVSLGCGAALEEEPLHDDSTFDDVGTLREALPKRLFGKMGKCHVRSGAHVLVIAGDYNADGDCCGMTRCTGDCDGKKYVEVCIFCDADPGTTCEDGHHTVARLYGGSYRSSLNVRR